ncbi:MAG: dihydroorotase [Pseudomonadota bacterium]
MKQVIQGAHLKDPARGRDQVADVWIDGEAIVAVGAPPENSAAFAAVDLKGCWLLPGLNDMSARVLDQPASELAAAAAGGVTTAVCPPTPGVPLDQPGAVRERLSALPAGPKVKPLGAMTRRHEGQQITDQDALAQSGCAGFQGLKPLADARVLRSALRYAASLDLLVVLKPEEPSLGAGCAHDGAIATRLGLPAIPRSAETAGLARDLALVADTGARVHFSTLSCGESVGMIRAAQERGLPVTADVAIHQLFLTEHDVIGFDAQCHVRPPLRSTGDRDRLIAGVADGTLSAVCSDHTPLSPDAKLAPFADTEPGISGLETLLNLGLRLVNDERISLERWIACVVDGPAGILGGTCFGIQSGAPADLVAFDPSLPFTPAGADWRSGGPNTPFVNWRFEGRVVGTWCRGSRVFSAGA